MTKPKLTADSTVVAVRSPGNSVSTTTTDAGVDVELGPVVLVSGENGADLAAVASDPVGQVEVVGDKIAYNTLGWVKAALIMIAETVSLGILSLPAVLASLGLVLGVLLILIFGLLATYTGYVVYQFKLAHPSMTSLAHGMELAFGRGGRWVAEATQDLMLVFIMAAHLVVFSVAGNVLSGHGVCTTLWMGVGAVVSFGVSLPRTMRGNAWFSMFSCASIATATLVAVISISISRPGLGTAHPFLPPGLSTFPRAAGAVSSIILAYNGHIAYPTIISEMHTPRDFPKALVLLETVTISFYLVVAVVIYTFAGQSVTAPALGSASPTVRKIAYAFAVPTIIVAGVIAALVAAKQLYAYAWAAQPKVMREKSARARWSWRGILAGLWVLAWVIAGVIPMFGLLLALIGALFGTWFALGFPSLLWLGMNWRGTARGSYGVRARGWRKAGLAVGNGGMVVLCAVVCVLGTYGSVREIAASQGGNKPFACGSNA
ncbi:hypothetical protein LTR53_004696 [Teratosphaeriaceae sp. CCFEE 6253]|nr:hypothetical protein LTR53_004696 [Teratosphaeriaceae sp. CCFEE 6253]